MKFWEKFLKNIVKIFADKYIKNYKKNSIEKTLRKSLSMLNTESIEEIILYIESKQNYDGAFINKAGKPDLYYSVFGLLLAECFEMQNILDKLKKYVFYFEYKNLNYIDLCCLSFILSKLDGDKSKVRKINNLIWQKIKLKNDINRNYLIFFATLAFYYNEDFFRIYNMKSYLKKQLITKKNTPPSSVLSAMLVLNSIFKKNNNIADILFNNFYSNGSFRALPNSIFSDLLSTSVVLYALNFSKIDLSEIKPDCLYYLDSLFENGGFCSNIFDTNSDIEYTFYGILALGALFTYK